MIKHYLTALTVVSLGFAAPQLRAAEEVAKQPCHILLTNDDGIGSKGISALYNELVKICKVTVSAPSGNRSGFSQSIGDALYGISVSDYESESGLTGYAVDSSPAVSTQLAILEFLIDEAPDMVVSGINAGENLGLLNLYSGTVGAAMEAAVHGIPSIAISQLSGDTDFQFGAREAVKLIEYALDRGIPKGIVLNVNIPSQGPHLGIDVVPLMSELPMSISFKKEIDDAGNDVFKHVLSRRDVALQADVAAAMGGKISITPIKVDRTAYELIDEISAWKIIRE